MLDLISILSAVVEAAEVAVNTAPQVAPDPTPTPPPPAPCVVPSTSTASTWGDLLSVLTVSVALNMAYFSVSSFVSPIAANQRALLSSLNNSIEKIANGDEKESKESVWGELQDRLVSLDHEEKAATKPFRIISLLAFFVGMTLVFVGTFWFEKTAPLWLPYVATSLNAPFIAMAFYVAVTLSGRYAKLSSDREKLVADVKQVLGTEAGARKKAKLEKEAADAKIKAEAAQRDVVQRKS